MIDIPYEVKRINSLLIDHFGLDSSTGQAIWRVVFSDDQYEKRLMPTTDEGLLLVKPEVRLVPKYKQWIPHMWVLEQLVVVPDININELPVAKLSYEPLFPFHDRFGNSTRPKFESCKFVIDTINAAKGKKPLKLHNPEGETTEEQIEATRNRVDRIVQDIFGDETDVSDHLTRQTGVVISNTDNLIKES